MKILAFDSIGGAAGDMILAAMIDLGIDTRELNQALTALGIGAFRILSEPCSAAGLHGLRLRIELPDAPTDASYAHDAGHHHPAATGPAAPANGHEHHDDHGHHHHHRHAAAEPSSDGDPGHTHAPAAHAPHDSLPHPHASDHHGRGLRDIRELITASALPQPVKEQSRSVFQRLAEAEGRVHQRDPETIHFHEVGALDSILDIVGCCWARHRLEIDQVTVSPLPIGRGSFRCAHGVLPIPAPATVELLRGFPVQPTDEPHELVTPTGAAILTTWCQPGDVPPAGRIQASGHGFGTRTLAGRPNLLRAVLMTADTPATAPPATCLELMCNLDDMSPEWIGPLIPGLLEAGALDAFLTPVQMKKQRPGWLLTVLCRLDDRIPLTDYLFRETTTFGIRWRQLEREVLTRRHETVQTAYGPIRIKVGNRNGRDSVSAPEYEACRLAAERHQVALRQVHTAAMAAMTGGLPK